MTCKIYTVINDKFELTGVTVSGNIELLKIGFPDNYLFVEGVFQQNKYKYCKETERMVDFVPPKPDDTELTAFEWNAEAWEWVGVPTLLARQNAARSDRGARLAACDWTQGRDIPDAVADMWAPYRQALRDVPEQPGFPDAIEWPTPPQ